LIDPQAGVKLVIPALENIGRLRQTPTPENGKSYWMAFSNKGRLVKRGHRVSVEIRQPKGSWWTNGAMLMRDAKSLFSGALISAGFVFALAAADVNRKVDDAVFGKPKA
jgi:hypothetical protein